MNSRERAFMRAEKRGVESGVATFRAEKTEIPQLASCHQGDSISSIGGAARSIVHCAKFSHTLILEENCARLSWLVQRKQCILRGISDSRRNYAATHPLARGQNSAHTFLLSFFTGVSAASTSS